MNKTLRGFMFGGAALAMTTFAGVSAAVAGVTLPDYHVFKIVGRSSNIYPMFIDTETKQVHVEEGSILPTQFSRCGYDRVGEAAIYSEGHITESRLSFPDMSYLVYNQHIDGRNILIVKDNDTPVYHLFGVQKSGKLVEKICSTFDAANGLVSGCTTRPNTKLPRDVFEAHAKTAVEACRRDVPQWNLDWKANQELTGVQDSFADYPQPKPAEIEAYKKRMRHNLQTLDADK